MFREEDRFEKHLGFRVAAFTLNGYCPRDEDVYVSYSLPGRQVARFAMRNDQTMFLFIFAYAKGRYDEEPGIDHTDILRAEGHDPANNAGGRPLNYSVFLHCLMRELQRSPEKKTGYGAEL